MILEKNKFVSDFVESGTGSKRYLQETLAKHNLTFSYADAPESAPSWQLEAPPTRISTQPQTELIKPQPWTKLKNRRCWQARCTTPAMTKSRPTSQ